MFEAPAYSDGSSLCRWSSPASQRRHTCSVFAHLGNSGVPIAVPWIVLTLGYAASELTVVHIEFRRDAHSVSLNEIPLVLALVFASPGHLLVAHLVGAGAVLVLHRRQAVLKLVFNLSHFALEDCVAIVVFHAVGRQRRCGWARRCGSRRWWPRSRPRPSASSR